MLTAIRDFASDTFDGTASATRLETIDAGEHTLWLVHGPRAYLACAIRGIPPVGLRDELAQVIETIHRRHDDLLSRVDDHPEQADRLRPLLEPCLKAERVEPSGRRFPWPFAVLALLVLAALGWWAKGLWETRSSEAADHARLEAAVDRLNASPGTLVTDWRIEQGRLVLTGLHDPLTKTPAQLLADAGLTQTDYETAFQPFESQVPAAVLARARQRLAPPAEVTLTLNYSAVLVAAGVADSAWIDRAALLATTVPGIRAYDATALEHRDDRMRRDLSARLAPPDTVELQVADGIGRLSGIAPMDWIGSLPGQLDLPTGRVVLEADRLKPYEAVRLKALRRQIEQVAIPFGDGATLDPNQRPRIESLAGLINELQQHAVRLERRIRLHVIGRTDGIGTPEQNLFVARERAMVVAEALEAQGLALPDMELNVIVLPPRAFGQTPDLRQRRVEFRLRDLGAGGAAQSVDR
jgi:outer membrane protein OmpA-like peptidoglycan-associated protein